MMLFGYRKYPSSGYYGEDDGGYSIDIFSDGIVEIKSYIFSNQEKSCDIYTIDKKSIQNIRDIINLQQLEIDEIPNILDNGSCDGEGYSFTFKDKRIECWNIAYYDIEEVKKQNIEYFNEYQENMKYENMIIDIFSRIIKVLIPSCIKLDIQSMEFF